MRVEVEGGSDGVKDGPVKVEGGPGKVEDGPGKSSEAEGRVEKGSPKTFVKTESLSLRDLEGGGDEAEGLLGCDSGNESEGGSSCLWR